MSTGMSLLLFDTLCYNITSQVKEALMSRDRPSSGSAEAKSESMAEMPALSSRTREAALEVLRDARIPLGAYHLIDRMEGRLGRKVAPPTIYRALESLQAQGLVSRIEAPSAYVASSHPGEVRRCVFFVCGECSHSVEIENPVLDNLLAQDADQLGFRIARRVLELEGTCASCQQQKSVDRGD
ncbi:MAG: transcriptional repressor [Rhodospirillaceae bacterium]|nr:transcriptional repressor [Rhodospirillaceae bacterium]